MENLYAFLMELDKLKSVYRRSYIFDKSRRENSAEHSWHLAIALLTLKDELQIDVDIIKTVKMALVHDICEIGAGDISIYHPDRHKKEAEEREYLKELLEKYKFKFVTEIKELWEKYEEKKTKESKWVGVVDRFLPFMMNLVTEGKNWKEQDICKSQVLEIMSFIEIEAPEIYYWIVLKIDMAVANGWLRGV